MRITTLLAWSLAALPGFFALPLVASEHCEPVDGIVSICGLAAPEDLVPAPNGRDLIFGQMAGSGGLYLLDTRDDSVHPLLAVQEADAPRELWGDPACVQPTSRLEAHGLDIRRRADGRWQVLVVNHAERESVEFYELQAPTSDRPQARWRGCAEAPAAANFNDVAGLADGSLLVTHMADRRWQLVNALLAALGRNTGFVYHWSRDDGFTPMPATRAAHPNGILLAPDEQSFFLNVYLGNALQHHALPGGDLLGAVAVPKPDNASWAKDGQLLVASHEGSLWQIFRSLSQDHERPSELPFSILSIDPVTLSQSTLLQRSGPPLGAGTVALQRGDDLYVGSYVGDRIIRLPLPEPQRP
ncbi:hypothetical protein [Haliea salexigens]|nr:hypothetical protein [Haliea salexigens]|tara:strand:- start:87391 stop:88461 length:1071 start_codon:yes stop_codon:yes gene_type:complete